MSSTRVPGEDLSYGVPIGLFATGAACTFAVVALLSGDAAATPKEVAPPAAPAAVLPEPPTPPAAAAPPASSAASAGCAPLAIVFKLGSSAAPETADAALAKLAEWVSHETDASLLVHGHADAQGNEDKNLALSRQRARNVAAALERAGVRHDRITVRGFGTYQPVEGEPEDAARNRRVEIIAKGGSCPYPNPEVISP